MKTAFITGCTGQDGSYLAELLLEKGYEVHGLMRRTSVFTTERVDHLRGDMGHYSDDCRFSLHYGDLTEPLRLRQLLTQIQPEEVYNLGAQSHVRTSFDQPIYTADSIAMGTLHLLEALRDYRDVSGVEVRFYQASSSEMFGSSPPPQNENTPFRPRSPYACAKVHAYHAVVNYREAYGLHASNGILFNHESPRRGETFVTRKITRAATRIMLGLQNKLYLGNLESRRDWGYAGDYVKAMWLMLQQDSPDDYVIATGHSIKVQQFLSMVFREIDREWIDYVIEDSRLFRPTEVDALQGNADKARRILGWEPKTTLQELVTMMVASDLELAEQEQCLATNGHKHRRPCDAHA
jgi:GDPmannose 4,6-dehydratase